VRAEVVVDAEESVPVAVAESPGVAVVFAGKVGNMAVWMDVGTGAVEEGARLMGSWPSSSQCSAKRSVSPSDRSTILNGTVCPSSCLAERAPFPIAMASGIEQSASSASSRKVRLHLGAKVRRRPGLRLCEGVQELGLELDCAMVVI
jgi:hypothetical protein